MRLLAVDQQQMLFDSLLANLKSTATSSSRSTSSSGLDVNGTMCVECTGTSSDLTAQAQKPAEDSNTATSGTSAAEGVSCPFPIGPEHLGTISGSEEGYYAALSANYLMGKIDSTLMPLSRSPGHEGGEEGVAKAFGASSDGTVGALDMGGSSTQIVFQLPSEDQSLSSESPGPLEPSQFFSHSYLGYGVDRVRERLWSDLVTSTGSFSEPAGEDGAAADVAAVVPNPCAFPGQEQQWQGARLMGTGNSTACAAALQRVLFAHCGDASGDAHSPTLEQGQMNSSSLSQDSRSCPIDNVQAPPVRGSFVAMSVYFFAFDAVQGLLEVAARSRGEDSEPVLPAWPTPSIR